MKRIDITASELKDYAESFKACVFQDDGIKLESKFSRILFDFSGLGATKCDLIFKRLSGDGKVLIRATKDEHMIVGSKVSQSITINIKDNLEINRDNCMGEITLCNIVAYCADNNMASNWRDILKHCGSYKCLRSFKGKLFASGGGYIEDKYAIQEIRTEPGGMFKREGGKIVFVGSCEITKLKVDKRGEKLVVEAPYSHREKPAPHIVPIVQEQDDAIHTVSAVDNQMQSNQDIVQAELNKNIIFSSTSLNAFSKFGPLQNKNVKLIRSNGKEYLLLRRGGSCALSISDLKNETEYIAVIKGKKLNGNGRVIFSLSFKENDFTNLSDSVFTSNLSNKYVSLKSSTCKYGQFHKLNMAMGDASSGEVLIEEILIVENIGINRTKGLMENSISTLRLSNAPESLPYNLSISADDDDFDPIYKISKAYARYTPIKKVSKIDNIERTVSTTVSSGLSWLNKISPYFPNVRLVKNVNDNTLMLGRAGSLSSAKRLWIDTFVDSELSDKDVEVLQKADIIYSPSYKNIETLKSKVNIDIEHCERMIPYIEPKKVDFFENKNFALIFHRGNTPTDKILSLWNDEYPTAVVVGIRGSMTGNVIPINEYLPYNELLYLIDKCKFVVDLPVYSEYGSAMLHIIRYMGVPIVSSNNCIENKNNCIFLPPIKKVGLYNMPKDQVIKDGITQALDMQRQADQVHEYKVKFIKNIKRLFAF